MCKKKLWCKKMSQVICKMYPSIRIYFQKHFFLSCVKKNNTKTEHFWRTALTIKGLSINVDHNLNDNYIVSSKRKFNETL